MCKDSQVRFNFGTFALIYMYFSPSFAYEGSCDCGLFAIAFATALVMGHKPEDVQFNQGKMRKHLWKCLGKKQMEMFPVTRQRRAQKAKFVQDINIYCKCRMPTMGEDMLQCSNCEQWYHISCVRVPQNALDDTSISWYCKQCQRYV